MAGCAPGTGPLAGWQPAHSPQNVTCTWSMVKPASAAGARQSAWPIAASTSATVPHRRQTMW